MRRRDFVKAIAGCGFALPLAAHGQQAQAMRRIGVLLARDPNDPEGQKQVEALREGLQELGWISGQTAQIEYRWVIANPGKALEFARELVAWNPDILIANGTPSLVAMRQTTNTIPVVFVAVADPVGQRFVPSLAHPGGNITGFSVEEASMGSKWLQLLMEVAPRVNRICAIYNPATAPYAPMFFPAIQSAVANQTATSTLSPIHTVSEIEGVFAKTASEPSGGAIILPDSFLFGQRRAIVALAASNRLPAIYPLRQFAGEGGLIAYGIDRVDVFRRAATYIDRILKGEKPGDLPVQQPIKFDLAVNLRTAKSLDLSIPQSILLSADEVIE